MYVPEPFALTELAALHRIIRENSFGLLIGQGNEETGGAPVATHLPFMIDDTRGPNGTLVAHMARANPHWRAFDGREALAVFSGPHAYVSPRSYGPGNAVPTWNYVAVHAYGVPVVIDDPARVEEILRALVGIHEGGAPAPWSMDGQPRDYLNGMIRGVAAFEIPIARIEGKAKLSQNRSAADQGRVAAALAESADEGDRRLAAAMRAMLGIS